MASVITEKCLGERYATCVAVCPVDCIYPGEYKGQEFMVIDPTLCITCGACISECPIGAIVESEDVDPEAAKLNAELAPQFKGNPKVAERAKSDPPRRPENKIVN
ncbi:MAG: ferredoxin family protein [Candidatus Omnitrophica bacterium]|nr:ferredoxin family protein [Candidatus Omnitrophota bacterium]